MATLCTVRLIVPTPEVLEGMRPYVNAHCTPQQLANFKVGNTTYIRVLTVHEALQLYPLVFAYGKATQATGLREIITAHGRSFPALPFADSTDIDWLFMPRYGSLLKSAGYGTVGDLTGRTKREVLELGILSSKGADDVERYLHAAGLAFRTDKD